jgi:uncharacterized protein (UPF0332 family)
MKEGKEAAKIRIVEELEVAKKRLEAAKLLFKNGMLEDSINRAYYSFFHAARAMLNSLGYDAKTHSGLISEFGLRLVRTGLLEKKFAEYIRKSYEMRESSDYQIGVVFGEDEIRTLIKNAEEFVREAERFVGEALRD